MVKSYISFYFSFISTLGMVTTLACEILQCLNLVNHPGDVAVSLECSKLSHF